MVLTHDHRETVQARVRRDPEFRGALLREAFRCLLAGEVGVVRILLRDCIIATVGFEQLGAMTGKSPESLEEMFGPEGDPPARELFEVLVCLQRHEGLVIKVSSEPGEVGLMDYTADPEDGYEDDLAGGYEDDNGASVAGGHEEDLTDDPEDHLKDTRSRAGAVAAV